jgi:hypothetical protein
LRRDWLDALGTRRDWPTYLANYVPDAEDPATLRCHALAARIALGRERDVERDALEQWLVDDSAPDACEPAVCLAAQSRAADAGSDRAARTSRARGEPHHARTLPGTRSARWPGRPVAAQADLLDRPQPTFDRLLENT